MLAELATFALILGWVLNVLQLLVLAAGSIKSSSARVTELVTQFAHFAQQSARPVAYMQFALASFALVALIHAFVYHDFSLFYVASHSNTYLPLGYRISAVWGGHEGSLLLWVWMLCLWTFGVACFSKLLPQVFVTWVLGVLAVICVGFQSFMLLTSNPFARAAGFFPLDGQDLNPLLQDIGLIMHPPMLYMGYVGFSVAFAFAIAGLMQGRLDTAWARWTRPWTLTAWAFLGCGIALGSWWAYYELGWGGWWFWDPVENASLMPWLAGTALIHSLAVTEKRAAFKHWTLFLAILTFSLSLLGTFLVRSGVLTSVHAFASDPTRGLFILVLLGLSVGGSLTLFAMRAHKVQSLGQYQWVSRESGILLNNILLSLALFVVLLGTLYPIISESLNLGLLSVGPPFFNWFFVPTTLALLAVLIVGLGARWKQDLPLELIKTWLLRFGMGAFLALLFLGLSPYNIGFRAWIALSLSLGVFVAILDDIRIKVRHASNLMLGLRRLKSNYWCMQLAHFGLVVTVIGVTMVSLYGVEKDMMLKVGQSVQVKDYVFRFDRLDTTEGPNFTATQGVFEVVNQGAGQSVHWLRPEKRNYWVRGDVMTEAAIDAGLFRDLYVSLGEPVAPDQWTVRVYIKPFIRWIWLGALIMGLAVIFSFFKKRKFMAKSKSAVAAGAS